MSKSKIQNPNSYIRQFVDSSIRGFVNSWIRQFVDSIIRIFGSSNHRIIEIWILSLVILLLYGCGYRLSGDINPFSEDIKTIAIPFLKNGTFEPGIESAFTNALREKFIKRGNLKIVERDGADVILEGSIMSFEIYPVAFSAVDNVMEQRAIVTLAAKLKRGTDGQVLWENAKIVKTTEYDVVLDLAITDANERAALGRIARELSEDIYREIFESKF